MARGIRSSHDIHNNERFGWVSDTREIGGFRRRGSPAPKGASSPPKGPSSIVFREFLTFTTDWEICFRSKSNLSRLEQMQFGHSSGTVEKQAIDGPHFEISLIRAIGEA